MTSSDGRHTMVTLRPYQPEDLERTVAMWHETNLASYPYVEEHQRHTLADATAFFKDQLAPRCDITLATRAGGAVVGLIALRAGHVDQPCVHIVDRRGVEIADRRDVDGVDRRVDRRDVDGGDRRGVDLVDQLCVHVPWQRTGIGTRLLEHARALHPSGLRLFTFQRNAKARAFYEKHGFRAVAFGISPAPENESDVEYRWSPPGV